MAAALRREGRDERATGCRGWGRRLPHAQQDRDDFSVHCGYACDVAVLGVGVDQRGDGRVAA